MTVADSDLPPSVAPRGHMNLLCKPQGLRIVLIKPSHYDDEGYVIQWLRSSMPSNSLAALFGLITDCAAREVLGPGVGLTVQAVDETNTRVVPGRMARSARQQQAALLVMMVGVQS